MRSFTRTRPLTLAVSTAIFVLWTVWVWYAKYLHCDDLLRDRGGLELRLQDGELERCTFPDARFAVYETMWTLGLVAFIAVVTVLVWSSRSVADDADAEWLRVGGEHVE